MKSQRRSSSFVCLVCGAPAIGFNFSVITCMCCKAFFRRNALFGLGAYQCRYSTDNCTINILTRRDCSYCRLRKCFQVGMKKELILTDEHKRLKREKIQANKQLKSNQITESIHLSHAYEYFCRIPIMTFEKRQYESTCHQPVKSRIKLQHYIHAYQVHRQALEGYFKQIPEFQNLPIEERTCLFHQNLRYLLKINSIETLDDSFPIWGSVHLLLQVIYGKVLLEELDRFLHRFKYHLNDSKSIELLLIILLLSTSINYTGHLNTVSLYRIQEKYLLLLWTHLSEQFGEYGACVKMSLIIRYCLYLQKLENIFEMKRKNTQLQDIFLTVQ